MWIGIEAGCFNDGWRRGILQGMPGTEQPQGLEPPPPWIVELHAYAEYSLDGGPAKVAGWSGLGFREDGLGLSWVTLDPVPRDTQEVTLIVTKLGDREGPWEFLVSLE
jgi:hypothetical protein